MRSRGQTTIELLMLLSVSLVALGIIYTLYSSQLTASIEAKEATMAKTTIQKIVNTANSLYASGSGSRARILFELPTTVRLIDSNIYGRTISIRLDNNTDLVGFSDVNLSGGWKKINGRFVKGNYYATLYFDGNVVNIYYDDFDLSSESFYISARQNSVNSKSLSVRNISAKPAQFWITNNYSHSPYSVLNLKSTDTSFVLTSGETRIIDFNVVLNGVAFGNYAGKLTVVGQIDDGINDYNITKDVVVSVEALSQLSALAIYPKVTTISGNSTSNPYVRSYSICNTTSSNISGITWSKDGNFTGVNNASNWFTLPTISDVNSASCQSFSLSISIDPTASLGVHDANIVATKDTNFAVSYLSITVTS